MQGGLIACQLDQFLSTYHFLEIKVVSFDVNVQGVFFLGGGAFPLKFYC